LDYCLLAATTALAYRRALAMAVNFMVFGALKASSDY